ncbi:MAG: DUF3825 domain-containing protein [Synechococcales cyanobacterium RM1_1_8]|nr:DUF3825 domain-containing protein [Synechococcales cyanobacterium RM1_1_8]
MRDLSELSPAEQNAYKQQLAQALTEDPETYGAIAQKCQAALTQAILKVQLNYRTAIPFYNPRSHRLQLLLPLSLMLFAALFVVSVQVAFTGVDLQDYPGAPVLIQAGASAIQKRSAGSSSDAIGSTSLPAGCLRFW